MNELFKKLFLHLALASKKIDNPVVTTGLSPRDIAKMLSSIEEGDERTEYEARIDMLRRRIERFKYL